MGNTIQPVNFIARAFNSSLTNKYVMDDAKDGERLERHIENENITRSYFRQDQEDEDFMSDLMNSANKPVSTTIPKNINNGQKQYERNLILSKLIRKDELNLLKNCYVDKDVNFETLGEQLISAPDGTEMELLDSYIIKNQLNKAQIYICLNFILEFLHSKKMKQLLQEELNDILAEYESEQSSYLMNFFSIITNDNLSRQIQHTQADILANFSSGNIRLADFKDTIKYIMHLFKDNWHGIVSMYVQIHAKQLKQLTKINLLIEDRISLTELLKMELKLQVIYSMFIQIEQFKEQLLTRGLKVNLTVAQTLLSIINLTEANFFAEAQIITWLNGCGLNNLSGKQYIVCIILLLKTIRLFPEQIFANDKERYKNIVNVLQQIIQSKTNASKPKRQLSFLKPNQDSFNNV